ncbi:MAG TPA: hypothetical protein PKA05_13090 [Roseiflexaceae bacterium]|nr:hypothetical protein [Roseiflexaceae bacterium]
MQLEQVTLTTPDLDLLNDFYGGRLGVATDYQQGTQLLVMIGSSRLVFVPGAPACYHYAMRVPAARFDDAYGWLVQFTAPISDMAGRDRFFSQSWDSDSVYAYSGRFDAGMLLSLCEIGIATDDVPALVGELAAVIGEGPFRGRQEPSFTAVGNANGLLIVVARGRIWYPETGVAAQLLPLQIRVRRADSRQVLISGPQYQIGADDA